MGLAYIMLIFSVQIVWFTSTIFLLTYEVFLFSGFEKQPRDMIQCFLFTIGGIANVVQPIHKYRHRYTVRSQVCVRLISLFLVVSVYNAFFLNIMMLPRYPDDIKTIDDVVLLKMKFFTAHKISVVFVIIIINLFYSFFNVFGLHCMTNLRTVNSVENAFDLAFNKNCAAVVSRYETVFNYNINLIKCFDKTQPFSTFPIVFFIRKDSNII